MISIKLAMIIIYNHHHLPVCDSGILALVVQCMPLDAGQNDAGKGRFLYELILDWVRGVVHV